MDGTALINSIIEQLKFTDIYHLYFDKFQSSLTEKTERQQKMFKFLLRNELMTTDGEIVFRNKVYEILATFIERDMNYNAFNEPLDYIRKAKICWERRFYKPLNNLCMELGIPFERKRSSSEQKELEIKWCELGSESLDNCHLRPVYAPKDLLETMSRLKSPNQRTETNVVSAKWKLLHLSFSNKSFSTLKQRFSSVVQSSLNIGLVETQLDFSDEYGQLMKNLFEERMKDAQLIYHLKYIPLCRAFALSGCPRSYRASMWCLMLCIDIKPKNRILYNNLKASVIENDLMIDRLIIRDVKLTSSNDDQYFIFEEYLYQVMLLFSRDFHIFHHFLPTNEKCPEALTKWKEGVYPPNGIIPFHGFTMLICPLCYVYEDPVTLYFVFRRLYLRYFYHLHHISSNSHGILRLSLIFEHLLESTELELYQHFETKAIQPLKCAFKWLMRAFSGYLSTTQVLLLWDQIITLDDIEILPVVAVGIFHFRRDILLQAQTQDETDALLSDLSSIEIIPILFEYFSSANDEDIF